jgi:hypothetical protein
VKDLQPLLAKLEEKIAEMFPESYTRAVESGEITRKICSRPMSPHGLSKITKLNNVISVGGTNSGGTAQATLLGQMVMFQIQHDAGLFKANGPLNEGIGEALQFIQQGLSYIGNAITLDQTEQPPTVVEPITNQQLVRASRDEEASAGLA